MTKLNDRLSKTLAGKRTVMAAEQKEMRGKDVLNTNKTPSPLAVTNDLAAVVGQPSQMASSSIREGWGEGAQATTGEVDKIAIRVSNLSKCYQIYDNPRDRLKQFVAPRIQRLAKLQPKQYYKEFWALKDVSFEIKKGETVGIIGRNGSGKSTLLQMICGTLTPTSGSIQTNGRIAALLELGSGFNPEFTGRENVYMNASVLGLSNEEIDARFDNIVAFADIGNFIEQPVKTYSSGMTVRLAFAVIAHVDADILVIDEALAVGDAVFTQKCMRFINEFRKNGAILFVSHDIGAISSISSRAIWLSYGEVATIGLTPEVVEKYHQDSLSEITSFHLNKNPANSANQQTKPKQYSTTKDLFQENQINPNATIAGQGKAVIIKAGIFNLNGVLVNSFFGNEEIKLVCQIEIRENIFGFLVGFTIKDRLGLKIIEENNSSYNKIKNVDVDKNSIISVSFDFKMPMLKAGTYSIDLSVAEGSQDKHIPQVWIYDAIQIDFNPSQEVYGLISVGLSNFYLDKNHD